MTLSVNCQYCQGTGKGPELPGPEHVEPGLCSFCRGTGEMAEVAIEAGYHPAVDVLECITLAELAALTDQKQEVVKLVLGAGYVNLNPGTTGRTKLANYFPSGATYDALSAMIGEPL